MEAGHGVNLLHARGLLNGGPTNWGIAWLVPKDFVRISSHGVVMGRPQVNSAGHISWECPPAKVRMVLAPIIYAIVCSSSFHNQTSMFGMDGLLFLSASYPAMNLSLATKMFKGRARSPIRNSPVWRE